MSVVKRKFVHGKRRTEASCLCDEDLVDKNRVIVVCPHYQFVEYFKRRIGEVVEGVLVDEVYNAEISDYPYLSVRDREREKSKESSPIWGIDFGKIILPGEIKKLAKFESYRGWMRDNEIPFLQPKEKIAKALVDVSQIGNGFDCIRAPVRNYVDEISQDLDRFLCDYKTGFKFFRFERFG